VLVDRVEDAVRLRLELLWEVEVYGPGPEVLVLDSGVTSSRSCPPPLLDRDEGGAWVEGTMLLELLRLLSGVLLLSPLYILPLADALLSLPTPSNQSKSSPASKLGRRRAACPPDIGGSGCLVGTLLDW
jgi:hypothetical protein